MSTEDLIVEYAKLYQKIKTSMLDEMLQNATLAEDQRQAIRMAVVLPHPLLVTREELEHIQQVVELFEDGKLLVDAANDYWSTGLKYVADQMLHTDVGRIIDMAKEKSEAAEDVHDIYEENYVRDTVRRTNEMVREIGLQIRALAIHTDLNLKARCPECHGDLVCVIAQSVNGQSHELRLRCFAQKKKECQATDWFVQQVERRSP